MLSDLPPKLDSSVTDLFASRFLVETKVAILLIPQSVRVLAKHKYPMEVTYDHV